MNQFLSLLFLSLLFAPIAFTNAQPALTDTRLSDAVEIKSAADNHSANAESLPLQAPAVNETPITPPSPAAIESSAAQPGSHPLAPVPETKDNASAVILETSPLANYPLAPGDTLNITVWKEEGLQEQEYLISPDGAIIFPLVGTVLAAGKTISELRDTLTSKLSDFISYPSVTVKLLGNQGNSIFVVGKVNKPGQYYASRKIDVLQALSLAGGLTVFADEDSISVLRRIGNETKVFPFDYTNVIVGDDLEQNILLEPGDTVTVP